MCGSGSKGKVSQDREKIYELEVLTFTNPESTTNLIPSIVTLAWSK